MAVRACYAATAAEFLQQSTEHVIGTLTTAFPFAVEEAQRYAWLEEIDTLRRVLPDFPGARVYLEFYIPRMGKRADVVLVIAGVIFILEFKVGSHDFTTDALSQAEDYALDLKNFHEGSHHCAVVPIVVTDALHVPPQTVRFAPDGVASVLKTNRAELGSCVRQVLQDVTIPPANLDAWHEAGYRPTPTIIEAAKVLYATHTVVDIARSDASAINLKETSDAVAEHVQKAREAGEKVICFVTGVPGSGKTLAGLNMASQSSATADGDLAVFLSGNGPLVDVLREALTRDQSEREKKSKKHVLREVRSFVQNIHHFRDEYLDQSKVPAERIVVFDESQRAWTADQLASFMKRKRGALLTVSEPEFLIGAMDRHADWCAIVCLVGNGQEINRGEAGIAEWIQALENSFPSWRVCISERMKSAEYDPDKVITNFMSSPRVISDERLHLAVSMRSFRAESLSSFIDSVLRGQPAEASAQYAQIKQSYPIVVTRRLDVARHWLRIRARGTERFGLVASSGALRLKPEGVFVKSQIDAPTWFLNDRDDVRSSYFLEEVASEFDVQGLELDWTGVCWDGDLSCQSGGWKYQSFKGTRWQKIADETRQSFLKNAYRVLLTRARQGMVIFVPFGDESDPTRPSSLYDGTFEYLKTCGVPEI